MSDGTAIVAALIQFAAYFLGGYLLGEGLGNPSLGWGIALLVWFHK